MPPMKVVTIDRNGRALDHVVHVSKVLNGPEDVMWVALSNAGPWEITFDKPAAAGAISFSPGSPFSANTYTVPQGGTVKTVDGPVNGNVGSTYKYNVRNATTHVITDDPDVDIDA